MATAAAPVVLTPLEEQARNELAQYGLAMIRKLASFPNGQPGKVAEVSTFQHAWNADKSEINSMLAKVGSTVRWWSLTEDGLWGSNTAGALAICCLIPGTSPPPTRSADIPAWYAKNQSLIEQAMVPNVPATATATAAPSAPAVASSPVPTPTDTSQVVGTAKDGTAVVIQSSTNPIPSTPKTAQTRTKPRSTSVQAPMVPSSASTALQTGETKIVSEMDFSDAPSTIVAAPVRSRVPWIAAGVGAVVLGGAMLYFTQKKRR